MWLIEMMALVIFTLWTMAFGYALFASLIELRGKGLTTKQIFMKICDLDEDPK